MLTFQYFLAVVYIKEDHPACKALMLPKWELTQPDITLEKLTIVAQRFSLKAIRIFKKINQR